MPITRLLLICGTLAAPFFILTDVVAATLLYPGYDYSAQQVSELSAIGAPSLPRSCKARSSAALADRALPYPVVSRLIDLWSCSTANP